MDEEEWIARAQKGDLDSFNRLVDRYQSQVYNLTYRTLSDHAAAEDVTQEAFISAFRAVASLRGVNFRAWIFRIAVNACHDYQRKRLRHPERSLEGLSDDGDAGEVKIPTEDAGPEDLALMAELSQFLQDGLAHLAEDQRTVVILSDIQGMSYEEIGDVTGANLGTVKSRLSRGRSRLREFLLEHRELLPRNYRLSR